MRNFFLILLYVHLLSCTGPESNEPSLDDTSVAAASDSAADKIISPVKVVEITVIQTGQTTPGELLTFAKSLNGIPYKYGSIDPVQGFDCSGFITYVFNHFNIAVPRSSVDFTNVEREIALNEARPGDIILFTGTDSTIRVVGHMGIIVSNDNNALEFIHSTSGKANGVTITPLNDYYMGRFVKVIRVFKQNDDN